MAGGYIMNMSIARQHYKMAKENAVDNTLQNARAIKLEMIQLHSSLSNLSSDLSPEQREEQFEIALTRIYLLQKCLDFERGGDLARNLFRVYEHARRAVIYSGNVNHSEYSLTDAVKFIGIVLDGWSKITEQD